MVVLCCIFQEFAPSDEELLLYRKDESDCIVLCCIFQEFAQSDEELLAYRKDEE